MDAVERALGVTFHGVSLQKEISFQARELWRGHVACAILLLCARFLPKVKHTFGCFCFHEDEARLTASMTPPIDKRGR